MKVLITGVAGFAGSHLAELALREGTITDAHPAVAAAPGADPPCPACGTAAPLAAGACSDCGLQLE